MCVYLQFVPESNLTPILIDEMGSFDPMLASFIPTEYLGSINSSVCVTNYDQIAYVSGTSSALFNEYNSSVSVAILLIWFSVLIHRETFLIGR